MPQPSYIQAYATGSLKEKAAAAWGTLESCRICPRACGVNRLMGEKGFCQTGDLALVSSTGPHYGEEDPLVGQYGSGTIFFSHCNLGCIFCQNYELSHLGEGREVSPETIAEKMLQLQSIGCHNINWVTPTHVVPMLLQALMIAVPQGLHLPLVYNCGGYESLSTLKWLEGIVDIYLPDFKFWENPVAAELAQAFDYPERAREAFKEMHRQVGDLKMDRQGIAQQGLLVRHLVMPSGLAGTREIMRFLAQELSLDTYVNVMDQYRPCGRAHACPDLSRPIHAEEYEQALTWAWEAGLRRLDQRKRPFIIRWN